MIQVGPTVRVENGPVQKTDVASEELLSNSRTAEHYWCGWLDKQTGEIVPHSMEMQKRYQEDLVVAKREGRVPRYKRGRDALGNPIVIGEPMTYLDYRAPWGWHVYKEQDCMIDEAGRITDDESEMKSVELRYRRIGTEESKESALAMAEAMED